MKNPCKMAGLYAITPDCLETNQLLDGIQQAILGGAQIVQYRNKQADAALRHQQASAILALTQQYGIPLIINDDAALAARIGAAGAHIGSEDGDLHQLRERYGADFILGASCYNRLDLALAADQAKADYIALGRFFPSNTKPEKIFADLNLVQAVQSQSHLPIVAIGGIQLNNAKPLVDAKIDAIAVIEGLFGAKDIQETARQFSRLFDQTK